jgi:hypothetical protein
MALPNLLENGDGIEKTTWPLLRDFFPHYETFWQIHIVPLRSTGSIHPRRGIDEDFEFLAMQHYSLYVTLGKAYARILGKEAFFNLEFPDDLYAQLQRVAELALKVVERFENIFHGCLKKKVKVDTRSITQLIDRVDGYRNLIHTQFLAVHADPSGRLLVPRPEKLDQYPKWTDVLYHARAEDFVDVHKQLISDFSALCSALENTWKSLCELSKQLVDNKVYREKQARGESVQVVNLTVPSASGTFIVRSSAVSNAVASPVVGPIMIRKPEE